jgi:hypothetical protein
MKTKSVLLFCLLGCFTLQAQTNGLFYLDLLSSFASEQSMTFDGQQYYYLSDSSGVSSLVKRDANHLPQWHKTFQDINQTIIEYSDDGLLLSGSQAPRNFTFCKMDTAGAVVWAKSLDYGDINIVTAQHATSHGYYQTGYRDYPTGIGFTFDITISRFSPSGTFLWSKAYGDNNYRYSNNCSVVLQDDGLVTAGSRDVQFGNTSQLILSRFDSSGNQVGIKSYDPGSFFTRMEPKCMYNFNDTAFIVCCAGYNTNNNYDVVVFKLDIAGNVIWTKRFYQIGYGEYPISMTMDNNGNPAILCRYFLTAQGFPGGYFLLVIDQNGSILSSNSIELFWSGATFETCRLQKTPNGYAFNSFYYDRSQFGYYPVALFTDNDFKASCPINEGSYALSFANPVTTAAVEPFLTVDNAITCTDISPVITDRTDPLPAFDDLCRLVSISQEPQQITLACYPNPASDFIRLETKEPVAVLITNASGETVFTGTIDSQQAIPVGNWASGVYIARIGNKAVRFCKL